MNFGGSGAARDELDIGLIPLIDVLLVILIFLAATTSFVKHSAIKVSLPRADGTQAVAARLDIAVGRDGRYALNGQLLQAQGAKAIARSLATARQDQDDVVLVINADAMATHQSVVDVMEAARLAGIPRVSFAARSAP